MSSLNIAHNLSILDTFAAVEQFFSAILVTKRLEFPV